ncbi:MAG: Ig-like domain-containing protein [Gemmatimonadota bacterium]
MITVDVPMGSASVDTMSMSLVAIRTTPAPPVVLYRADSVPLVVRVGQPTRADTVRATYVGPGQNIQSITISPRSAALRPGDTLSLSATAIDSTGATISGMPVLWTSHASGIVSVSAGGTARAVANGQTWVVAVSGARSSVRDSAAIVVATTPVAVIGFAPATLSFTAPAGGANPPDQTVAVTNVGAGPLGSLTVSAVQYGSGQPTGWLSATLSNSSAPATLTIQVTTGSLTPGTYTANVPLVSPQAANSPQNLPVTFTVAPVPSIGLSPTSIAVVDTLGTADPAAQTVAITNTGTGTVSGLAVGTITYGASQPTGWLTAALSGATAPATLTLTLAKGALPSGVYTATVPITSPVANNSPRTVTVTFDVRPLASIAFSTPSLSFLDTVTTSDPAAQTVSVTNAGTGTLSGLAVGTISYGASQPTGWLTAALSGTTAPATLTVTVAKGSLTPGVYTATVPIASAAAGNSPQNLTVTFDVRPLPLIGLTPAAITFTDTLLTTDPAAKTVAVANAGTGTLSGLVVGTITYGASQPTGWLTAALGGTAAPATLTLTVAKGALPQGLYTATVPITSTTAGNSPQSVTVTFDLRPPPLVSMQTLPGFFVLLPTDTVRLQVFGKDGAGNNAPALGLRFSSRTPGVAAVDSLTGLVTGVAAGTTIIVASAPGATGTVLDSALIAVPANGQAVAFATVNAASFASAKVGDTLRVLIGVDLRGVPRELLGSYNAQLDWNPTVARYVSTETVPLIGFTAPTLNETLASSGQLRFGAANATGAAGPVVGLVYVKFVADAAGTSPLTFALTDLSTAISFVQLLTRAPAALVLSGSVRVQ